MTSTKEGSNLPFYLLPFDKFWLAGILCYHSLCLKCMQQAFLISFCCIYIIFLYLTHRLYKEALKQAAVDPATGKIDITILTTGMSGAARKRKADVAAALKKLIQGKGKIPTLKHQKLYEDFREAQEFVSFPRLCAAIVIKRWFYINLNVKCKNTVVIILGLSVYISDTIFFFFTRIVLSLCLTLYILTLQE